MKYMKRANIYQASNYNVTFSPETLNAYSYKWWRFVAKIDGLVIFNNYRYSVSTGKHQSKVDRLMRELGIKTDITLELPQGINTDNLSELFVTAEEALCDKFLNEELKREARNERAKERRLERKAAAAKAVTKAALEAYLEHQVHFRDYDIFPKELFGKVNKIAVHQMVDAESVERDVENALHSFHRDGFGSVVFYV